MVKPATKAVAKTPTRANNATPGPGLRRPSLGEVGAQAEAEAERAAAKAPEHCGQAETLMAAERQLAKLRAKGAGAGSALVT